MIRTEQQSTATAAATPASPARRFRHRALTTAALAITSLAAIGCNQDLSAPTSATTLSRFTAEIAGDLQLALAGKAAVVSNPAATINGTAFPATAVLGLIDRNGATVAFQWGTDTPTPGTYTVGMGASDVTMTFEQATATPGSTFDGTSGTVTIASATTQGITGTFSVSATAPDTHANVTVSGSFSAPLVNGNTLSAASQLGVPAGPRSYSGPGAAMASYR